MADTHWLHAVSGYFSTAADWSTGRVPVAGDDAVLDAAGSPYTVTATTHETVGSIQTTAGATLAIASGTFHALAGTGSGANAGSIVVEDRGRFRVGGAFENTGAITLAGGPAFQIIVGAVTLDGGGAMPTLFLHGGARFSGGGTVTLIDGTIESSARHVVIKNVDNTINGGGEIGGAGLTLINETDGILTASGALTIDTMLFDNGGLIEATDLGGDLVIGGGFHNTGTAEVQGGGTITFGGQVTGVGKFRLDGGKLDFTSSFDGDVYFHGRTTNTLELGQSQAFAGSLDNFSKAGRGTLDLADIGFVSAGEASFSGTDLSGTLTVTDGTHTARIALVGDYLGATFTARGDGHNGTAIVATEARSAVSAHGFLAASAALGGRSAGAVTAMASETARDPSTLLVKPG